MVAGVQPCGVVALVGFAARWIYFATSTQRNSDGQFGWRSAKAFFAATAAVVPPPLLLPPPRLRRDVAHRSPETSAVRSWTTAARRGSRALSSGAVRCLRDRRMSAGLRHHTGRIDIPLSASVSRDIAAALDDLHLITLWRAARKRVTTSVAVHELCVEGQVAWRRSWSSSGLGLSIKKNKLSVRITRVGTR
jgi:hypothetical protein